MSSCLREVVEFYNSRDIDERWGEPEVPETVNTEEFGNLGLTDTEIDDLVALMAINQANNDSCHGFYISRCFSL